MTKNAAMNMSSFHVQKHTLSAIDVQIRGRISYVAAILANLIRVKATLVSQGTPR
jgi:hypothetical protein